MTQVVDYSSARPNPRDLITSGFAGAMRYLARLPNIKVITGDELAALHAAGLAVGFVWEVGVDWTTWDGAEADRQLAALAAPPSIPIYWAVDKDVNDYGLVGRMLDGVNSSRPRGIYGGSGLVEWNVENGHAAYGWIAGASSWGHGQAAPNAHLHQRVGGAPPGCDVNDVLQDDWGQWPAPSTSPTPHPQPPKDDDMATRVMIDFDGHRYVFKTDEHTGEVRYTLDNNEQFGNAIPGGLLGSAPWVDVDRHGHLRVSGKGHDDDLTWYTTLAPGGGVAWATWLNT